MSRRKADDPLEKIPKGKTPAQLGKERREKRVCEEYKKLTSSNAGGPMFIYKYIALKEEISQYTVLRILQRYGYVKRYKRVEMTDEEIDASDAAKGRPRRVVSLKYLGENETDESVDTRKAARR